MNIRAGQRVEVSKYSKKPGTGYYDQVPDGLATFQQFGTSFEEFENGAGNYSTAIIVRDDGSVENPSVELIKFIEKTVNEDNRNEYQEYTGTDGKTHLRNA